MYVIYFNNVFLLFLSTYNTHLYIVYHMQNHVTTLLTILFALIILRYVIYDPMEALVADWPVCWIIDSRTAKWYLHT